MDNTCQVGLLEAWMRMSICIRGNRILADMSLNEMLVCNQLYAHRDDPEALTASTLGRYTRLLKSQINKILSTMEQKGIIERVPSQQDRRKAYIHLREDAVGRYLQEHERVMALMDRIVQDMGPENARMLTQLIHSAIESTDQFQGEQGTP